MSKSASTWSSSPTRSPSSATSRPGMKSSTSTSSRPSPSSAESGEPRIAAIRRKAATNEGASSARITPRLPARIVGLSTHGYVTRSAAASGSSETSRSVKRGDRTPARAKASRIRCLLRVVETASRELDRRPRRSAMAAPTTVVRSSTGTTASTGWRRANSATVLAALIGSPKSSVRRLSGSADSRTFGRSDATTSSTSSFAAAATKSSVRYVVVGIRRSRRSMRTLATAPGRDTRARARRERPGGQAVRRVRPSTGRSRDSCPSRDPSCPGPR